MTPVNQVRRRLLLEKLLRQRRASDYERYLESFRRAAVDANPHQLEAVTFALGGLPFGGALLCNEVGLGKTIEAGLIFTQLRAEGKGYILVVVPLPLVRQWQAELLDLFGLRARPLGKDALEVDTPGLYIIGRQLAARRVAQLRSDWNLLVFDEAHEDSAVSTAAISVSAPIWPIPTKGMLVRRLLLSSLSGRRRCCC